MIEICELKRWLDALTGDYVAIDEGGLTMVELDANCRPTEADCEIGGIPEYEEEE